MTLVVIDTNAVHRDPWLRNAPAAALVRHAATGECRLMLPKVVIDELRRQQSDWLLRSLEDGAKLIERMRGNPVDVGAAAASLESSFRDLRLQIEASFDVLIGEPGVEVLPVPASADLTARLVERDLSRRRPFLEVGSEPWSAGYRDAVIWETVLDVLASSSGDETLIFVTDDHGFLADDKKSLHADLQADLLDRGIAPERVRTAQNVYLAQSEVAGIVSAAADAAKRAELVRVATDAVYAHDGEDISMQMIYGGEYDYPDFVKFEVPPMESQMIAAIDQITEFVLIVDDDREDIVTATATVLLSIEGAVGKAEWFMDAGMGAEIYGDLNDHYFDAGAAVEARAVVKIDVSKGAGKYEVESVVFEDIAT